MLPSPGMKIVIWSRRPRLTAIFVSQTVMLYHGQWVIPHWTGNYMITVNPVGGVKAAEQKATTQVLFVLLNEFRNGDRRTQSLVRDIHRALYPEASSLFAPLSNDARASRRSGGARCPDGAAVGRCRCTSHRLRRAPTGGAAARAQ